MSFRNVLIGAALLSATSVQALTIDADKYFAYIVAGNGEAYLLSHSACELNMEGVEGKWKQAGVQGRTGYFPPVRACWADLSGLDRRYLHYWGVTGDGVMVCTSPDPLSCVPFYKAGFIDTATLPKQADF